MNISKVNIYFINEFIIIYLFHIDNNNQLPLQFGI